MDVSIKQAVQRIQSQGVIIYPTETFWGVGGLGTSPEVVQKIRVLKKRPEHKPFPLIAGSLEQVLNFASLDDSGRDLAKRFWPGSLSILARAKQTLAPGVRDESGMVSIRVCPHPGAAQLCLEVGAPLIATSANPSGGASCSRLQEINSGIIQEADLILDWQPYPAGGLPSTLVRVLGPARVQVLRPGKVAQEELEKSGWEVV